MTKVVIQNNLGRVDQCQASTCDLDDFVTNLKKKIDTFAFWLITRKIFKIPNLFTKNLRARRVSVMLANNSVMKVSTFYDVKVPITVIR